ncbi:DNA polymerase III subunit gamma/tau [bacterium]|nr:DNA polymerase III subunit gamma/tau [bacterium]
MAYLAIARKWRPHSFEDLVGQGHVVQTLTNAIRLNRVSHAYLFSGARGIGKTSVARIFAKALRCPNAKDAVPCNTCNECVAISESRSVDVVEIDGASNNGVEAVRGIRDNVAYGAASGNYKIYIIDEVHMLSLSAFNALLKTLEEPPAHVIFLLATTEVQKIPLTVLGRCQRFEFRRLTSQQIIDRIQQILKTEGISISEEGLRLIASHSDGSLRDALSLLDQVLSYFGGNSKKSDKDTLIFNDTQVVEALGISQTNVVSDYWKFIVHKDIKKLLALISEAYLSGVDLKHFAERCLEELRLLYLIQAAKESREDLTAEALDISSIHFKELSALSEKTSLIQLERMAQILSKTISQISWSSLPRFVLEVASVRMTKLDELDQFQQSSSHGGDKRPIMTDDGSATETEPSVPEKKEIKVVPKLEVIPSSQVEPEPHGERAENGGEPWKAFVEFVMKKRPLLGALLNHASFALEDINNGKNVTLGFGEGSFYEKQASDPKNIQDITAFLKTYFGPQSVLKLSNSETNAKQSLEKGRQAEEATLRKSALEHPAVSQAREIFGAEVVDVRVEI